MKRIISLILVFTLLFTLGITASAASQRIESKDLYYREVRIFVNGAELIPQDVNGKSTEPFIIEGTTYLPVRALAGALGLKVGWDGNTNTITLTSGAEVNMGAGQPSLTKEIVKADVYYKNVKIILDGSELIPTDVNGKYVEPFLMGGSTYLPLRAIANALGLIVGWNEKTNTITLDEPGITVLSYYSKTITNDYYTSTEFSRFNYNSEGYLLSVSANQGERDLGVQCSYKNGMLTDIEAVTNDGSAGRSWIYNNALQLLRQEDYSNGQLMSYRDLSYYPNGNLSCISYVDDASCPDWIYNVFYEYDSRGRLSCEYSPEYSYTYEYDNYDQIVKEQFTSVDGYSWWYSYTYTADGFLSSIIYSDDSGFTSKTLLSYDRYGTLIREEFTSPDNNYIITYSYDANGNILSEKRQEFDSSYSYTWELSFKYDSLGRVIEFCVTDSDGYSSRETTVYAADGRSSRSTVVENETTYYIDSKYDSRGETTERITTYPDEVIVEKFEYATVTDGTNFFEILDLCYELGYVFPTPYF